MKPTSIRILELSNNAKGDLFGRLMSDLFIALGYEQPHLNIHKAGRELDLSADHRLEKRRAIGECKATAEPVGGADLNKFVGQLDAEFSIDRPISGYFVSLSGFTETALEQERQRKKKIVTLDSFQVVKELIEGRILISRERATELAGRFCAELGELVLDLAVELLAHKRGWVWAVYYTQGKQRTHCVLIHSDGTPLARAIADEIVDSDRECGGTLHRLTCLNPSPLFTPAIETSVHDALSAYRQYLITECGFIQLDGLPADSDVGSRRLRLENLFVPLHLDVLRKERGEIKRTERQQVGRTLKTRQHLAILAAPGGGKSTLVKRLAVAYVDPARRKEIADNLPEQDWFPLFFRCRELRDLARGSFQELLLTLSQREPIRQHDQAFRSYVDRALLDGRILLLVDGLDEISDPGDRAAFVCTIRSAVLAYPGTALIVTSREAGFRHVAAHLGSLCTQATVSPLNEKDIHRLTVGWHREVVGDSEKVRLDAEQLATTIVKNDRIKRLAVNPLLLTTLLLVKRWVGSLPTRRAVLYGKAVEVLLMTWNTEGHDPIPHEEALPQLCYVASAMMFAGEQKISRPRLATSLQEARDALPTELGYVEGTVDQFIHRVEDRSSLLMMSGLDVEEAQLVEFFEFRHLTFQEFLTARAMVEGWHPGRKESDALTSVLEPHFTKGDWSEVIPLAAALGGKATERLIQRLTERVAVLDNVNPGDNSVMFSALLNCLADESAARPDTIRAAVHQLVRFGTSLVNVEATATLARGKYGQELRDEARRAFLSENSDIAAAGDALSETVWWQTLEDDVDGYTKAGTQLLDMIRSADLITRVEGANGIAKLCIALLDDERKALRPKCAEILMAAGPLLSKMLFQDREVECGSACYALGLVAALRIWKPLESGPLLGRLFSMWRGQSSDVIRYMAARALSYFPIVPREEVANKISISSSELLQLLEEYDQLDEEMEQAAVLSLAWYFSLLNDNEIGRLAQGLLEDAVAAIHAEKMLEELIVAVGYSSPTAK